MKSSQELCTSNHVMKIEGLEEKLVRQAEMLGEVVDKVLFVIVILQINLIILIVNISVTIISLLIILIHRSLYSSRCQPW